MSVVRVQMMFNKFVFGWSETLWSRDVALAQSATDFQNLINSRIRSLYKDVSVVGVRASVVGEVDPSSGLRNAVLMTPGPDTWVDGVTPIRFDGIGGIPTNTASESEDQLRAALQVGFYFDGNRRSIRYFSGISDSLSGTEPNTLVPQNSPVYWGRMQDYLTLIVKTGWQLLAQKVGATAKVFFVATITKQVTAPNLLGITIRTPGALGVVQGSKIALQRFRAAKGSRSATLNGIWYVDSVDTSGAPAAATIYLRGSEAIVPSQCRFTDKSLVRLVEYATYPISNFQPIRVGIHKRGRPSLAPHGRRLTRYTLDP